MKFCHDTSDAISGHDEVVLTKKKRKRKNLVGISLLSSPYSVRSSLGILHRHPLEIVFPIKGKRLDQPLPMVC